MGFDIQHISNKKRLILSKEDFDYQKKCLKCRHKYVCGGWSFKNDARYCDNKCSTCRVFCSKAPDDRVEIAIESLYLEGSTLDIRDHKWEPWDINLPKVAFQLNNAVQVGHYEDLYIITVKLLFNEGSKTWSQEKDLRKRFNIPESSKIAISFCVSDDILDYLAYNLDSVAMEIAEYDPDFVFSINFSMYSNFPRIDQLINLKRKFASLDYFQRAGLRVIPDIDYFNEADLRNVSKWLKDNNCSVVSMNIQPNTIPTSKHESWRRVIEHIETVVEASGNPDLHLVLVGGSGKDRVKHFIKKFNNLTIVDSKCYRLAEFHKNQDNLVEVSVDLPPKMLFAKNAYEYKEYIGGLYGR